MLFRTCFGISLTFETLKQVQGDIGILCLRLQYLSILTTLHSAQPVFQELFQHFIPFIIIFIHPLVTMKDERNKIFAKNLKAERYRKGITQAELAEYVDVSESTISLLERGLQTPSIFLVYDISKVLNVDINDLLKNIS